VEGKDKEKEGMKVLDGRRGGAVDGGRTARRAGDA